MSDNQLTWHEDYDRHNRAKWAASSIYHSDGCPFDFRITQTRKGFKETSDAELIGAQGPRLWPSLKEAKAAMQADHEAMIAAEQQNPEG